ncbi:MAG: TetR/AcrR family transcriptional regulator [Panacagrimonas sp.]
MKDSQLSGREERGHQASASGRGTRGRPQNAEKRDAILDCAKRLFARHGLDGTSMDQIAAQAGVSKVTVYRHFNCKEDLFRYAVTAKCAQHTPDAVFLGQSDEPVRQRLCRIGEGFLDLILDEDPMNLCRLLASQGARVNRLGRLFWESGPARNIGLLAQYLTTVHDAGDLDIADPERAATHFLSMMKGQHHLKQLVGAESMLPSQARKKYVKEAVDVFLRAYAPR